MFSWERAPPRWRSCGQWLLWNPALPGDYLYLAIRTLSPGNQNIVGRNVGPTGILPDNTVSKRRSYVGHLHCQVHIPQLRAPKQLGIMKLLATIDPKRIAWFNAMIGARIKLQLVVLHSGNPSHKRQTPQVFIHFCHHLGKQSLHGLAVFHPPEGISSKTNRISWFLMPIATGTIGFLEDHITTECIMHEHFHSKGSLRITQAQATQAVIPESALKVFR